MLTDIEIIDIVINHDCANKIALIAAWNRLKAALQNNGAVANEPPTAAAAPCPKYESCAHRIVCKYLPNGSCVGEYDVWPVG